MKPHWVIEYISFVCRHCKAPFEKACDLVEHKKLSHPQELLYYPLPDDKKNSSSGRTKFKSQSIIPATKESLTKNVTKLLQKRTVYLCQHCKEKLPSFDDLLEHKLALHPELTPYLGDYSCQMCQSRYTDRRNYENHMLNHKAKLRSNTDYPCNSCGMRFLTENSLASHASENHSVMECSAVSDSEDAANSFQDLVCRYCEKKLPHNFALRQHLRRMHGCELVEDKVGGDDSDAPEDISCPSDDDQVKPGSNEDFSLVTTDVQGGRLSCSFCTRQLRSVSELTEHERTHTGERPFLCRLCGKGFARARALSAHQKEHPSLENDAEEDQAVYQPPTVANQPLVKPKPAVPPLLAIKNMPQLKLQHNVLAQQAIKKLSDSIHFTEHGNGIRGGIVRRSTVAETTRRRSVEKPHECYSCHKVFARSVDLSLHEKQVHGQRRPKIQRSRTSTGESSDPSPSDNDTEGPLVSEVLVGSSRRSSYSAMSSQGGEDFHQVNEQGRSESFKKLLAQHRRRKIYCKLCNKDFPTFEMLFNHRKFKHPHLMRKAGEYRCNLCHTVNTDRDTFNRHVKAHEARMEHGTDFPCELCDKRFLSQPKLDMHLAEHHPDAVEEEKESSASEFTIQESQEIDDAHQFYRLSDDQSQLGKKARTERRLIQCRFCEYVARGNQAWKEHERLHTGERPYPCRICGKRFNRLRNRRSHERGVHRLGKLPQGSSRRESFEGVTEGDENDFSEEVQSNADDQEDSSMLQSQQAKQPSYRCTFCDFGFTNMNTLLMHIKNCKSESSRSIANPRLKKVIKGKKLYDCSHCDEGFTSRGALFYHKAKAHREHRIQCPKCDASYVLESQLRAHLKAKHGLKVDENELMEYADSEENDMISPEAFVQVSLDPLAYLDDENSQSISPRSPDEEPEPMEYESEEVSRAAAFFGVLNLKPRKSFASTLAGKDESS